eukprot:TRINITY_DN2777_c0_g1_i2.p2 TRINITY_DN2777_c0_g1~~TRINITY_DN2777_c0_g1_i2.p2  ORF type:complete len:142 (-),score=52.90 TRINITY_DN2777_c0_g1_i2:21-446(-)
MDDEFNQQKQATIKTLADMERKLQETSERIKVEESQKRIAQLELINQQKLKLLEKKIGEEIDDFAVFGTLKSSQPRNSSGDIKQLEHVSIDHDDNSLDSFLDEEQDEPKQQIKSSLLSDDEEEEEEDNYPVHVILEDEHPV